MLSKKPNIGIVCCLMIILQYVDAGTVAVHSILQSPPLSLDGAAECLAKHSKAAVKCQSLISAYSDGDQLQFYQDMCCSVVQYKRCLEDMARILCGDNATHLILEQKGLLPHLDRCNGYDNIAKCNKSKSFVVLDWMSIIALIDCYNTYGREFAKCDRAVVRSQTETALGVLTRLMCCGIERQLRSCHENTVRGVCSRAAAAMLKNAWGRLNHIILETIGEGCDDVKCRS